MKITKSQLREIIREEVEKLKQPKMSTRLKELINKGWVLSEDQETVKNPETGREIKVKTALSYPSWHPAHKAVIQKRQDVQNKKGATQAVSSMRGKVSSDTKTDKVLKNFVDTSNNRVNYEALEKLSHKSKEKLYKLVDTRFKLVGKIEDRLEKNKRELDVKYNGTDIGNVAQYAGTDDSGNKTYAVGGKTFSGPDLKKYQDFWSDSPEAKRAKDISGWGYGNLTAAYKNAAWTLKNPKMGVMAPDEAQSIVDEFETVANDHDKTENLTKGVGGKLSDLRDELRYYLEDSGKWDKNIKGTRFSKD